MNLQDIAEATAEHYGTTVEAMCGYSRLPEDVRPRQVYCFLADKWTGESKSQIGRIIRRNAIAFATNRNHEGPNL